LNDRFLSRAYSFLNEHLKDNVARGKALARETTMRVGGPAAIFAVTDTLEQLKIVVQTVKEWDLDLFVIGKGSNLLVSDDGYNGVVLRLGKDFMRRKTDGVTVRAGAATSLPFLVQEVAKQSLDGLSFGVGIPGSLGGAVKMNAGAHDDCIGGIVKNILVFTKNGELKQRENNEIAFSYRSSNISGEEIIVEATLELKYGDHDTIKRRMEDYFSKRKKSQPLQFPNAGSIFKNPGMLSAGQLIDGAGCKGAAIGDAQVSDKHANFIVNKGDASATDVFELVRLVQKRVFEASGIILEPEIQFLGEFENMLMTVEKTGMNKLQ
jgi:UDP-N-acetylmuramate dehydrogenase